MIRRPNRRPNPPWPQPADDHAELPKAALFAAEVMGEFKAEEAERVRRKDEELTPLIEAALKRKTWMKPLADSEIAPMVALGRHVAERAAADGKRLPPNPAREPWIAALEQAR